MDDLFKETHHRIRLWKSFPADYPAHFHDAVEIIFVLSGTACAYCNGTAYPLRKGSIFFVSPNFIHSYQDRSADYCHILLIVDPAKLNEETQLFLTQSVPKEPIWQDTELTHKIWNLINIAIEIQSDISNTSLTLLLSTIISLISENLEFQKSNPSKQSIKLILEYCRTHFREPISLNLISRTLHFSESYISHSFSNILKISLPDYINGLRLNEAVRLLKTTKLSITEIAAQAGFPTTRTFNRVFTKQYAISPTQFRKQA